MSTENLKNISPNVIVYHYRDSQGLNHLQKPLKPSTVANGAKSRLNIQQSIEKSAQIVQKCGNEFTWYT